MKFIDLNKQYHKIKEQIDRDVLDTIEKGDFILGQNVQILEQKLAKYVGVKECITCASGTDALQIPLMAYGIGRGDAVFTTNFSYFATTEVISLVGATPIFVDINNKTFNIDPDLLENQIIETLDSNSLKPKAIIAVDLFGQLADYTKIEKIAKKYNLLLIEDAAQSFGASYNGQKSCSFGDVAATSFFPAKPLGCYGDGGAIFTNDSKIADLCRSIRVHGKGEDKYDNIRVGLNSRLDTIQASILLNKLKIFDDEIKSRNEIAQKYNDLLKDIFVTPYVDKNNISSWAQYSILTSNSHERDKVMDYLNSKGIPTAIYYKKLFSDLDIYSNIVNKKFPISENIKDRIFSIPMHPYLETSEIKKITDNIMDFFNNE